MSQISFNRVVKTFSKKNQKGSSSKFTAVNNVELNIEAGEIFGVIGHSGAGKSTLVRLINQLEKPDSGQINVLGYSVGNLPEKKTKELRKQIGMIFQQFNLFNFKTVFKNIEYPLILAKIDKEERHQRVNELLDFIGLKEKANEHPGKLSGGQKQRVGIARALATNPKIILADEATSALDPETTLEVLRILREVNKKFGVTIVLITHTMSIVRLICERVAVMDNGKIVEVGETKQIFQNPKHEITKRFISTIHALEKGDLDAV